MRARGGKILDILIRMAAMIGQIESSLGAYDFGGFVMHWYEILTCMDQFAVFWYIYKYSMIAISVDILSKPYKYTKHICKFTVFLAVHARICVKSYFKHHLYYGNPGVNHRDDECSVTECVTKMSINNACVDLNFSPIISLSLLFARTEIHANSGCSGETVQMHNARRPKSRALAQLLFIPWRRRREGYRFGVIRPYPHSLLSVSENSLFPSLLQAHPPNNFFIVFKLATF